MMVSVSNGALASDDTSKRPLVNGCVSKWKTRKVSAVRDFPPGCGRNVAPKTEETVAACEKVDVEVNGAKSSDVGEPVILYDVQVSGTVNEEVVNIQRPETDDVEGVAEGKSNVRENGMDSGGVNNSHLEIDSRSHEAAGSPMDVEGVAEGKSNVRENGMGSGGVNNSHVEIDSRSHEAAGSPMDVDVGVALDLLVEKVAASTCGIENVMVENGSPEMRVQNEVCGQADEVITVPVKVESDVLMDTLVGEVDMMVDGFFNDTDEVTTETTVMKNESSVQVTEVEGCSVQKELNEVDALNLVQNSQIEEAKLVSDAGASVQSVLLPGGSKLLSATNENIKLERVMRMKNKYRRRKVCAVRDFPPNCGRNTSASGNNCPISTGDIKVESEPTMSNDIDDVQANDLLAESKSGREVVHGLMAAPYCPWRKGKASLHSSTSGQSEGALKQQRLKSGPVPSDSSPTEHGGGLSNKKRPLSYLSDADRRSNSTTFLDNEDCGAYNKSPVDITPISMVQPETDSAGPLGKELCAYSPGINDNGKSSHSTFSSAEDENGQGSIAAMISKVKKKKVGSSNSVGADGGEVQTMNPLWRNKSQLVAKKSIARKSTGIGELSGASSVKPKGGRPTSSDDGLPMESPVSKKKESLVIRLPAFNKNKKDLDVRLPPVSKKKKQFDIRLPPFGPNHNIHGDSRNRVRETLRYFNGICRKLLQKEEGNSVPDEECRSKLSGKKLTRIDLAAAKIIKERGKEVNTEKRYLGAVPGVEVGDEFQYRTELAVIGIHRPYQAGIDWMKLDGETVASSIVTSGAYNDDTEHADVLIYSGQGGNIVGKCKIPEDQKLERGNLALYNSVAKGNPVRVIRGWRETIKGTDPLDSRSKLVTTYVYDGLYTVARYWDEYPEPHNKRVYKFELIRNSGQPELAWKELKKASKSKTRPGVCVKDISGGKEPFPICAVNVFDDEKPPQFTYISKMMYPQWYRANPPVGCDCVGRCGSSKKCLCAARNGGEIPYNHNGAIVEVKHLVYECGPHCKCPPSCYNRVTQRGIKVKLEIFKTESRGWGIRALTSVPSGSFICEYAGELLQDKEAEERIGNDEYLFDIGQNFSDSSLNPEDEALSVELTEEGGYTIDACHYGNVGRFINHSCSPNLYAQNVVYDHDDKRIPHVMLFAAENIPPLQELTYHYNYKLNEVLDADGNVKVKKCFCGSAECTGRMY